MFRNVSELLLTQYPLNYFSYTVYKEQKTVHCTTRGENKLFFAKVRRSNLQEICTVQHFSYLCA